MVTTPFRCAGGRLRCLNLPLVQRQNPLKIVDDARILCNTNAFALLQVDLRDKRNKTNKQVDSPKLSGNAGAV